MPSTPAAEAGARRIYSAPIVRVPLMSGESLVHHNLIQVIGCNAFLFSNIRPGWLKGSQLFKSKNAIRVENVTATIQCHSHDDHATTVKLYQVLAPLEADL